jgi:hypothetical protein
MALVTWENISDNLQIKGNKIRRSLTTGDYWSGANIVDPITYGTGFIKFNILPLADSSNSTTIVGVSDKVRVAANDEYAFSFYFTDDEVFAYEFGDLGGYAGIPLINGAKFRLKMLSGNVEYQVKNPSDIDYETFVTSTLVMDVNIAYTANVTIKTVEDEVHILGMSSKRRTSKDHCNH